MKKSDRPITSYPLRTRKSYVYQDPACTVCKDKITLGQRYYDKTHYAVHEGCVKLLKAKGSGV